MKPYPLVEKLGQETFQKIAIRQVIWVMALWSGIDSLHKAIAHFSRRENFVFAWKNKNFQHYFTLGKVKDLPKHLCLSLFKAPENDQWPYPLDDETDRQHPTEKDLEEICEGLKMRLDRGLDISSALLQTKIDLNYQSLNWHLGCGLGKDLLASLETNGRCVNEEGDLLLLCRQFELPAEVFCQSEMICEKVNYQVNLLNMNKDQFSLHLFDLNMSAALTALRLYYQKGVIELANAVHIKPVRYMNFERGVEKIPDDLFRKILELYPDDYDFDILVNN